MNRYTAIAVIAAGIFTANSGLASDLSIRINGVKNASGTILIALHDGAKGFPLKRTPVAVREAQARSGTVTVNFEGLQAGNYAISLFHDENGNKDLDTNLVGLPTEGYGFSNNARNRFGPPKFSAAGFALSAADATINVTVVY